MAFYGSSKATKARADKPEEFHRLAGPAVKPCCWLGPAAAKHALPRNQANGYYAVKRETPWTYHAEGRRGIRSKWDAEVFCAQETRFLRPLSRVFSAIFFFSIRFDCRLSASALRFIHFLLNDSIVIFLPFFPSFFQIAHLLPSTLRSEYIIEMTKALRIVIYIRRIESRKKPPAVNLSDRDDHIYSLQH